LSRRGALVALAAGVALGTLTRLVYELPDEWWWLAKIGGPWLLVAFVLGCTAHNAGEGAPRGAVALVAAVLVYYTILGIVQHSYDSSPLGLAWLLVAVPAGATFGALATWRRTSHAPMLLPAAVLAAVAAEAATAALAAPLAS
jgi:hypothetical protein